MRPSTTAQWVTYLLEPKNWLIVTTLAIGWHADGAAGLGFGAVAAVFAAVLPMAFINRGVRRGQWNDRNVGAKRPRLIVLAFLIASVAVGLALLVGLGAPGELSATSPACSDRSPCSPRSRRCGRSPSTVRSRPAR